MSVNKNLVEFHQMPMLQSRDLLKKTVPTTPITGLPAMIKNLIPSLTRSNRQVTSVIMIHSKTYLCLKLWKNSNHMSEDSRKNVI